MHIDPSRSVGQIAVEIPAAIEAFEAKNIDYCCHGGLSLTEACRKVATDPAAVIEAISAAVAAAGTAPRTWTNGTLTELIDFINTTHHVYTRATLDRLRGLAAAVVAAHEDDHPEVTKVQMLVYELERELIPHMMKEEQILFPYVLELEAALMAGRTAPAAFFGTVRNPIQMMLMEHEAAAEKLVELRAVTSGYKAPEDGCTKFRLLYQTAYELEQDVHRHMHLENNVLFPRAIELEATRAAYAGAV